MTFVTPSAFALAFAQSRPREGQIIRLAAYVARYGRQPWSEIMSMPMTRLVAFSTEIAELIKLENAPGKFEDR